MLSNKTVIINIKRKDRNSRVMRHENQVRNSKKPYFIGVCKMEKENQDKNVLKTSKVVNGLSTVWCGYQQSLRLCHVRGFQIQLWFHAQFSLQDQ